MILWIITQGGDIIYDIKNTDTEYIKSIYNALLDDYNNKTYKNLIIIFNGYTCRGIYNKESGNIININAHYILEQEGNVNVLQIINYRCRINNNGSKIYYHTLTKTI